MSDQTFTFAITGQSTQYVDISVDELSSVEGRYHDLVRRKAVAAGLITEIEARTAHVAPTIRPPAG